MKTFPIFAFLLCLLAYTDSFAQLHQIPLDIKIEKAATIVEGEVILSQSYKENGNIYTAHLIEIHQVFKKDKEVSPYVTVVTLGGIYGGYKEEWSHLLELSEGNKGLFFLIPTNRPSIENPRFLGGDFEVYSSGQGFLNYVEGVNGVSVRDFVQEYESKKWLYKRITERTGEFPEVLLKTKESCIVISVEPSETVQPVGSIGFDVKIRTVDGNYKLYQSLVAVKYDTDFFGSNVISNGILTYKDSGISKSNAYALSATDLDKDILQIRVGFIGNPATDLITITPEKRNIGSFVVKLSTVSEEPPFKFDSELMKEENLYYDEETGRGRPFRCIEIENQLFMVCPDITSFSPQEAAAGVGLQSVNGIPGVITITGLNFGTPAPGSSVQKPDNYRVGFRNAGKGNFYVYPPERDYISWNSTTIQVKVPAVGETGNLMEYAGTGNIIVVKTDETDCFDTSDEELYVPFCARNNALFYPSNSTRKSIPTKLADANTAGGYDVLLDQSFLDLPGNSREAFLRALATWQCEVDVNFIEKSFDDVLDLNTVCNVTVDATVPAGVDITTAAVTTVDPLDCSNFDHVFLPRWDMRFNKYYTNDVGTAIEIVWYTEEGEIPPAQNMLPNVSLEGVALHEIGHALLLRHVNNADKVMKQGVHRLTLTPDDKNGGIHTIDFSSADPHCQNPHKKYDCILDNLTELNKKDLVFYPNPVEDKVTIELEEAFKGNVEIYNSLGQLLSIKRIDQSAGSFDLNVSGLDGGMYYLSLISEENTAITIKITKL